ncbi:MAG TPA: hypothetical protein VEZ88_02040, partial [Steroidobacteraceae bacterium]|nr:hypothetical protein [Steroidobacteraceae bacterium]
MHDGSVATLAEVIDHYSAGGRQAPLGPAASNVLKDRRIRPFQISVQEKADLVAFLESLTDQEFVHDRRFRNDADPHSARSDPDAHATPIERPQQHPPERREAQRVDE